MHVLCVIPTMASPGGAERTMSYLAAHWAQHHVVSLLTLESPDTPSFYPLPQSVRHIRMGKLGGRGTERLWRVLSRPELMRRQVRHLAPDVVISFMDTMNITVLIGCLGLGIPIVVSERNDPSLHRIGLAKEMARDRIYPLARFLVVQTRRIASYFSPSLRPKMRIIANPIPTAPMPARPDIPNAEGRKRIIGVGRLAAHKGFDRLIDAFALIAGDRPDWDLVLIGEGPERPALEGRIRRCGLEGRTRLTGVVTDVSRELAASHLMAFPSRYEGFPNALAEGLAAGLPAIAHAGVSGVEELIVDGKTGLLVDPRQGSGPLAAALSALMDDTRRRRELGDAARNHVVQWAPNHIFGLWEAVLAEAVRPT
jgi:glycosyltransferase involved in cell wall biosynthesis